MIHAARMPDPPTRPASDASANPRVPQLHRTVSAPVQQDVTIEPVHRQRFGARSGAVPGVIKPLELAEGPRRQGLGVRPDDDGAVARCDGEVGDSGVRTG